nr:hypothetical protein Itr_chr13CG09290 [Ipomoea trifida]
MAPLPNPCRCLTPPEEKAIVAGAGLPLLVVKLCSAFIGDEDHRREGNVAAGLAGRRVGRNGAIAEPMSLPHTTGREGHCCRCWFAAVSCQALLRLHWRRRPPPGLNLLSDALTGCHQLLATAVDREVEGERGRGTDRRLRCSCCFRRS